MKRTRPSPEERFWALVDRGDQAGCWLWTGRKDRDGYGIVSLRSIRVSPMRAHRASWIFSRGPIAEGLQIDHLCRVVACVRPDHLEPVTPRVNTLRSSAPSARLAVRTHCDRGHEFDAANTRIRRDGSRACRACHRRWQAEYLERKAGAA